MPSETRGKEAGDRLTIFPLLCQARGAERKADVSVRNGPIPGILPDTTGYPSTIVVVAQKIAFCIVGGAKIRIEALKFGAIVICHDV